jgi:hypothetical protein
LRVVVQAFAVHAHTGGNDQTLHRALRERLEQHRGPAVVHVRVVVDAIHALSHADRGGEVEHHVHAPEGVVDRLAVPHVADQQLHAVAQITGRRLALAMDLGREIVEGANPMACREEGVGEVGADEPGAAGDQDLLHVSALRSAQALRRSVQWSASANVRRRSTKGMA